ncbi:toxin HicA [Geothermobacter hydrogeniphilus]|uniref:Toxin HicA n=1 Tax=Geothermobacter hydrogeniphilus TaxID=1969733 RepID=A0A2K2HCC4_9BACT|nr:toxin HicA [Geothermobacter hydrogeniphilus]
MHDGALVPNKRLLKRVRQIIEKPKDVDFSALQRLLESFGYECRQPRRGSSHYVFRKAGAAPITVPKKKPVNAVYVKQVIKLLDLEEWYEKNS